MDPLSVGASALNLHQREDETDKPDDAFREIIVSCRSLSNYETRSIRSALPQITASIISASFHIVIGIALSFSAIFIPQAESPDSDLPVTQAETSWIASIIVIVGPVASMTSGVVMDYIGRLNTIKLAAIPAIIGWILIATATNVPQILVGRVLTGFGCVAGTSPAIVYITEVARPDMRGSLISMGPTLASFGMVIGYAKGAFFNWRVLSWISIGYCLLPVVLIALFAPESPVWLVNKGRMEDAAASLKYLYKNYPQPEHTSQTLADMHLTSLIKEKEARLMERMRNSSKPDFQNMKKRSKMRGFLKPTGYKPLVVLFFLFLIQQFSGIYITLFYAVTFFQDIGSTVDAYTCSILFGVTRFIMSLLNAWLLKRFKRRHLVMTSSIGMAICMGVSGLATYGLKNDIETPAWIPVVFLLLYVCASMIGLLTIPWTMTAELFPNDIRGIAHSLSYSIANILMFVAVQTYRDLQRFLGSSWALQWFFAVVSIVGFFFGLFILPETHGKKLKDIEDYFSGKTTEAQYKKQQQQQHPPKQLKTISEHEVMLKENHT